MFKKATFILSSCFLGFALLACADVPVAVDERLKQLESQVSEEKADDIQAYLNEHEDTDAAKQLRDRWLQYLASQQSWPLYLQFYKKNKNNTQICWYLTARYHTEEKATVLAQVEKLWLVPYSQPAACDELFKSWQEAGYLTEPLIWKRLRLALKHKQFKLARYVRNLLPETEHSKADLWIHITRQPSLLMTTTFKQSPIAQLMILDGLLLLADKEPYKAIHAWNKLKDSQDFTSDEQAKIQRKFAIELALRGDPNSETWFSLFNAKPDDKVALEWRIRNALKQQAWPRVITLIEALPANLREKPCWQYWLARALQHQQQLDVANRIFKKLAQERHYYGFLANHHLGEPPNLNASEPQFTEEELSRIANNEHIRMAKEYYQANEFSKARKCWNTALKDFNKHEKHIAATLAKQWGWHEQAILTAKDSAYQDDLPLRFPIVHKEQITDMAKQYQLSPAFIYAIIRQESSFQHDAHSPDGARGLMQLLPKTAADYHRASAQAIKESLYDVELNIRLGSKHLKRMLQRFRGQYVFVAASYNAGERRVQRWIHRRDTRDLTIWIDTLPWYETRNYIKNVLTYWVIYQHYLGHSPSLNNVFRP